MSEKFHVAVERVLGHEGGYSNRSLADDPGGETNWGVTIGTARANGYHGDMKTMNRNEAICDLQACLLGSQQAWRHCHSLWRSRCLTVR